MAIMWLIISVLGGVLYRSVIAQHVPGYPNPGQTRFYLVVPVVMAILSWVLVLFSKRLTTFVIVLCAGLQLLALLGWLFFGGGGV